MTQPNPITALVIVDVQEGMLDLPGIGPVGRDELLANICTLIDGARSANYPIVYIQHEGVAGQALAKTVPGHAIAREIAPRAEDKVVSKAECGMFKATELEKVLTELDVRRLIICGMQTEFCVDTAVRTAADRGYKVIIAAGAHATFDTGSLSAGSIADHHEAVWQQAFGQVVDVHDIEFREGASVSA
ncbi:MAG: cysteine hydrolase family protein [Pseudomonadota bacterium]